MNELHYLHSTVHNHSDLGQETQVMACVAMKQILNGTAICVGPGSAAARFQPRFARIKFFNAYGL